MSGGDDLFDVAGDGPEGDGERTPSPFFRLVEATEQALGGAKRGRPAGARNRKSEAFERWYFAKGYKDPAQFLGELISADTIALANAIGDEVTRLEVLNLQRAAAAELMPYLHGKMPVKVEVEGGALPVLVIAAGDNQLAQAAAIEQRRALSVGSPIVDGEVKEINGLEDGK